MQNRVLVSAVVVVLSGCASKPAPFPPGAEMVRVATSYPGESFVDLGPVSGTDGSGCGDAGPRGSHGGAVASLMKNAFAMGGTHVQVTEMFEPRQMGPCFVNTYTISGTAYRQARAAPVRAAQQSGGSDPVQALREAQRLRAEGAITQQEFERLKARIIGSP